MICVLEIPHSSSPVLSSSIRTSRVPFEGICLVILPPFSSRSPGSDVLVLHCDPHFKKKHHSAPR